MRGLGRRGPGARRVGRRPPTTDRSRSFFFSSGGTCRTHETTELRHHGGLHHEGGELHVTNYVIITTTTTVKVKVKFCKRRLRGFIDRRRIGVTRVIGSTSEGARRRGATRRAGTRTRTRGTIAPRIRSASKLDRRSGALCERTGCTTGRCSCSGTVDVLRGDRACRADRGFRRTIGICRGGGRSYIS